jgi:hypothetical protein
MDSVLLRAILAMDAYNRGYNAGIKNLNESPIGDATFFKDKGDTTAQAAGFYAVAYTLADGSKVISYRGTDQNEPGLIAGTEFGSDLFNGYGLGIGSPYSNQTKLA